MAAELPIDPPGMQCLSPRTLRRPQLTVIGKHRAIGNSPTSQHWTLGPLDFGHLKVAFYGHIGPGLEVEHRVEIILRAPATAVEAIEEAISRKGWHFDSSLASPLWEANKIVVDCCMEIPSHFIDKISEIVSMVNDLSTASQPRPVSRCSKSMRSVEQGNRDAEEDELDEEACDGLECWDE